MELDELKTMWAQYDARIQDNTRVNRKILRQMIAGDIRKGMGRIKFTNGASALYAFLVWAFVFIFIAPFRSDPYYWVGAVLFTAVTIVYIVRMTMLSMRMDGLDTSETVVSIKRKMLDLEKAFMRLRMWNLIFAPVNLIGISMLLPTKYTYGLTHDIDGHDVVLYLLIAAVMILSILRGLYAEKRRFEKFKAPLKQLSEFEGEV